MWVFDVHWKLALYFKEEMNGRTMGEGLTMVCRWWDFQATLGKTILLSDIAGTALSTTRLVDWLLLMLLKSSCRFPSRGRRGERADYLLPSTRPEELGFRASRKRETKKKSRIAVQNKLDWKFFSGLSRYSIQFPKCELPHRCILSWQSIWNAIEKSRPFKTNCQYLVLYDCSYILTQLWKILCSTS